MIVHWTQARKTLPRSLDGHGFYLGYGDALSANIIVHSNLDLRQNFSFDRSRHPYWFFGEMLNTLNKLCPMHFPACLLAPCMVLCQTMPCGSSCSACSAKRTLFNLFYKFYYPKLNSNPQSSNSWDGVIFFYLLYSQGQNNQTLHQKPSDRALSATFYTRQCSLRVV